MNYKDAIKQIRQKNFKKVLVTGPQRSGTTICSKILSRELNFPFISESEFNVDKLDLLNEVLADKENYVVQAPGLFHVSYKLDEYFDCVIFIERRNQDILDSIARVRWSYWAIEVNKTYAQKEEVLSLLKDKNIEFNYNEDLIRQVLTWKIANSFLIKKYFWDMYKLLIDNNFTIEYDSFSDHSMFIEKIKRKNFHIKQTK